MTMRLVLFALWLVLAMLWASGIHLIARGIGGYQYIQHLELGRQVAMLGIMTALCIVSGLTLMLAKTIPRWLAVAVLLVAGVHVLNVIGFFVLLYSTRDSGALLTPFILLSSILPTTTWFIGAPPGNGTLFLLPLSTIVLLVLSIAAGSRSLRPPRPTAA